MEQTITKPDSDCHICNRQNEYLQADDIKKMLHINQNAVYQLFKRPGFPAVRVSARRIVVPADAFRQWMINNQGL